MVTEFRGSEVPPPLRDLPRAHRSGPGLSGSRLYTATGRAFLTPLLAFR
jgi:hypothetical protein